MTDPEVDYLPLVDPDVVEIWVVDEDDLDKIERLVIRKSGNDFILDELEWWRENGSDDYRLVKYGETIAFVIFEGSHWERGDRDESVDLPCEERGYYWALTRADAVHWIAGQEATKERIARNERSDAIRNGSKEGLASFLTAFGEFVTHDSAGEVGTGLDWAKYARQFVGVDE